MKAVKISLAVIAIAAIAFFVIWSLTPPEKPEDTVLSKNQFTLRIEQEIDSLGNMPDNKFSQEVYKEIDYRINSYYDEGRLGENSSENDQWKENLTKNLYSAYADKFIKQAFYVFHGSEWNVEDLRFIRSEYQTLRKSGLLEKGSPVDKKFTEIQTIFNKYDEVVGFVNNSKGFSYSASGLSNRFPISEVRSKITQTRTYLSNRLENKYVNNCVHLRDELKEIPQSLFKTHVRYLDNKIIYWSEMYPNYASQSDYVNNLYKLLKSEIDALDNNIYNVPNFDSEYNRLSKKWSADNTKAYNYKYSTL